ncbi:MAG: 4-hydroxythreonine-4-phosphate dehydrogenase PdxA [Fuerstiella sp.]|nr:4-hydroxythreonine-4-phosphate dehydrogenase PdxA [Fuerstiella sp.]
MAHRPIIAITPGDVAGVGPEVVVHAIRDSTVRANCQPIVVGDPRMLSRAEKGWATVGEVHYVALAESLPGRNQIQSVIAQSSPGCIPVVNPCGDKALEVRTNEVSAIAGEVAYRCLTTAGRMALDGSVDGIATAPLNKKSLHAAGYRYPGHTEILAEQCGVDDFAMTLHLPESRLQLLRKSISSEETGVRRGSGHGLSIAHVTLHTSVASVPRLLTRDSIVATILLMRDFLKRLGCARRSIGVAALNPHAGENGLFGNEEANLIVPAVDTAKSQGCHVSGPLPADTLIRRAISGEFDGVIAMYHDQGHIPIKLIGFDAAINITLGLPIVRTSPTHGTAFDRAWNPATPADPAGMIQSVITAAELCQLRPVRPDSEG